MKLNLEKIIEKLLLLLIFVLPFNFRYIFNFSATQNILFFKENFQYSLFFFDLIFLAIFCIWFFQKIKDKKINHFLKNNWLLLSLIYYLGWNAFHFSSDFHFSLYNLSRILEVLMFFLILIDLVKTKKIFDKIIYLIFISGVIQSIIAILQFIFQKSLGLKYLGESVLSPQILGVAKLEIQGEKFIRGYGTFPHPNLFGAFLFLSLIAGSYFVLKQDWKIPFSLPPKFKKIKLKRQTKKLTEKVHLATGLIVILAGIIITFSRSVWLITALFLLTFIFGYFVFRKHEFKSVFKSVFMIALVSGSLFFIFQKFIPARFCSGNCQDQSSSLRQNYSQFSQKIIITHPLTGIGIGQFVPFFKEKNPKKLARWDLQPVHNLYLITWSETGLIGFVLIFFLIFSKFNFFFSSPCLENHLFFFLITGFFILGLFDHYFWTLPQGQFIFWLSLALFIISGKINK